MKEPLILTIDFGTQSVRAGLFNKKGETVALEKVKYEPAYVSPKPGLAEQDPDYYFESLCKATNALMKKNKDKMDQVLGVVMDFFRDSVVCVDKNGKPTRPLILWLDERRAEGKEKLPLSARAIFKLVGMGPTIELNRKRSMAVWLQENEPEVWKKTDKFMMISTYINYKLMKCVDGFALLSLAMSEHIPTCNKPVVQIEGIFDSGCGSFPEVQKQRAILYSGNLGKRYGIIDLLDAFTKTSIDYKLLICGVGDGADDVKRYAEKDSRIVFLGSLPRTEVLRLQSEASLLINPRHKADAFTRYSFPSKTMEYMASGTPTLMSELDCLPEDYKQHLYSLEKLF